MCVVDSDCLIFLKTCFHLVKSVPGLKFREFCFIYHSQACFTRVCFNNTKVQIGPETTV